LLLAVDTAALVHAFASPMVNEATEGGGLDLRLAEVELLRDLRLRLRDHNAPPARRKRRQQ